jgi:hypothetical protein
MKNKKIITPDTVAIFRKSQKAAAALLRTTVYFRSEEQKKAVWKKLIDSGKSLTEFFQETCNKLIGK